MKNTRTGFTDVAALIVIVKECFVEYRYGGDEETRKQQSLED